MKKLPKKIEQFLRYEMVRAHAYWDFYSPEAIRATGLEYKVYDSIHKNYMKYKDNSEEWRSKSQSNEDAFTEQATEMCKRIQEAYQKELKIKKEVEEIMARALSEPAPF